MEVKLIAITKSLLPGFGVPEELIEHSARVCHGNGDQGGEVGGMVIKLLQMGHLSPLEHASASFEVSGISRACANQIVRHRIASYSQESLRHVDATDIPFIIPEAVQHSAEAMTAWRHARCAIEDAYAEMRIAGIKKEDARAILPLATATRIIITMNFRELRHFFRERISPAAQAEVKAVAEKMLDLIFAQAPDCFGDCLVLQSGRTPGTKE